MNRKIIVDTSVWIEYFKNNADIASFMEKNLLEDNIAIVGIIVSELIQGIKHIRDREIIRSNINALEYIDIKYEDWVATGELSGTLRKNGVTLPLTDIVIAAAAIKHDLQLATLDRHFKLIPDLKLVQPLLP